MGGRKAKIRDRRAENKTIVMMRRATHTEQLEVGGRRARRECSIIRRYCRPPSNKSDLAG